MTLAPPDPHARAAALARSAAQAKPLGALGRLEHLAAWLAACQGTCPPEPLHDVRVVVFAGDHGVAAHGVSAYPASVTPLMVREIVAGRAGVNALAASVGVRVRVVDIAVDDDLDGLPEAVSGGKLRRGSGAIHLTEAITRSEAERALAHGAELARAEIADGAQLLIAGDLGIGNTTPAAALIAALTGSPAAAVTGRGTGIDAETLAHKRALIGRAVARCAGADPLGQLAGLGSADLAAAAGFMIGAAEAGTPVLLDGVIALAEALVAERLAPGAVAWMAAGHRSPEPAASIALEALGLEPLLDLGLRLGEGTGAVLAVPLLRAAIAGLRDIAPLADVLSGR